MTPSKEERIADRCPSCGSQTLFIGSGGWLTCSLIGCKDPCVGEVIAALQQENERLKADKEKMAITVKDTVTSALALDGENSSLKDQVRNLEKFLHSRGGANLKKQILDHRALLRELAEGLKQQIPSYNNPADRCWCPNYLNLKDGHSPQCVKARAALARVEEVLDAKS